MGRISFRFITIHAFDRQTDEEQTDGRTDGRTDIWLITIPRLHSCSAVKMLTGKLYAERKEYE